jgi:hypothetical protein
VCKDVWEVKDAAVGPPKALSYLLAALQLQQRSAGNLLAPRAGACRHETRLADRPLFPVGHTSAINVTAWQAEFWVLPSTAILVGLRSSARSVVIGIHVTTHMHIPLHIR